MQPSQRVQTRTDQEQLLRRLSEYFNIERTVSHCEQGRSTACIRTRHITLSDSSKLGRLAVCLHEFAHLLAEHRHRGIGHRHGAYFRGALLDTIAALNMAPQDYPWHAEYVSIYRWARLRFLLVTLRR